MDEHEHEHNCIRHVVSLVFKYSNLNVLILIITISHLNELILYLYMI